MVWKEEGFLSFSGLLTQKCLRVLIEHGTRTQTQTLEFCKSDLNPVTNTYTLLKPFSRLKITQQRQWRLPQIY